MNYKQISSNFTPASDYLSAVGVTELMIEGCMQGYACEVSMRGEPASAAKVDEGRKMVSGLTIVFGTIVYVVARQLF